jgi:hypothetical protein
VFFEVCAFQIKRDQVIRFRLNGREKEIGLLDWIAGLAKMISAPLVTALLRFDLPVRVFLVDPIANRGAMNDGDDALVRRELVPIDVVPFERVDDDCNVRILPW